MQRYGVSVRRACKVLGHFRSRQRHPKQPRNNRAFLRQDIVRLAGQYGRYGYRRITAMLPAEGWQVNHKRVERIWRQEELKCPRINPSAVDYIYMTVRVFVCAHAGEITYGAMIS